jgi:hypothetical protein
LAAIRSAKLALARSTNRAFASPPEADDLLMRSPPFGFCSAEFIRTDTDHPVKETLVFFTQAQLIWPNSPSSLETLANHQAKGLFGLSRPKGGAI